MSSQAFDGAPQEAATEFDVQDHFLHPGDGRPGESFAIKMYIKGPVRGARHTNCSRVLPCTAEEKPSEGVGVWRSGTVLCAQEKCARAVTEQATEFSRDAARFEEAAVDVGGDDSYGASLSGDDEPLGDGQSVQ